MPIGACASRARNGKLPRASVAARLISERRLAIGAHCSQRHLHNVLAGVCHATPELAAHGQAEQRTPAELEPELAA